MYVLHVLKHRGTHNAFQVASDQQRCNGGCAVAVPSGSLPDLVSLAAKHPTVSSTVWYAFILLLGRKTKPLSAIKTLFGWAGEIVEAFYEFKAHCAESRERHAHGAEARLHSHTPVKD
jgi:hypothetical protein